MALSCSILIIMTMLVVPWFYSQQLVVAFTIQIPTATASVAKPTNTMMMKSTQSQATSHKGYFTVIGDFGRQGQDHQTDVALQMVQWCQSVNTSCDFSIGVGGRSFFIIRMTMARM